MFFFQILKVYKMKIFLLIIVFIAVIVSVDVLFYAYVKLLANKVKKTFTVTLLLHFSF